MKDRLKALLKKKPMLYGALGFVALSAVLGGLYSALGTKKSVTATAAGYHNLEESFVEDGLVSAQNRVAVSTDTGGKVIFVMIEEGQAVKKGDTLLTLDSAELNSNLTLLEAERDAVLASWGQSDEQINQQIASLKAQRAGYYTSEQKESLNSQIERLYASLDPQINGSAAYSYRQMSMLIDERLSYAQYRLGKAYDDSPAAAEAIKTQLNAASLQLASFEHEQKLYKAQYDADVAQKEAAILAAAGNPALQATLQADLDAYKSNSLLGTYSQLISAANAQVADLRNSLSRAQNQIPETVDSLNTQIMGIKAEKESLEEQWSNYKLQANAQILNLQAQLSSEKGIRSGIDKQISLLESSAGDTSNTADYYKAQLKRIDASIAEVERKIENSAILAPIDGVVGAVNAIAGQTLPPGSEITRIVNPDELLVECMLLTGDVGSISESTPVTLIWERNDADATYPARVERISSLAVNSLSAVGLNEQRVKVILKPDFKEEIHPMDGYQLRVRFTLTSETTLAVNKSAVIKSDMGDAVFVIDDGIARLTPVKTGLESEGMIAIVSGLSADSFVIDNPEGIDDGDGVKVQAA